MAFLTSDISGFIPIDVDLRCAALLQFCAEHAGRVEAPGQLTVGGEGNHSPVASSFWIDLKFIPETKIQWRNVWAAAITTAVFLTIGKDLIGLYLGKAGVSSTYGAAGSLVVVVVWAYYSAQIFFFGAEFTHVYARSKGRLPTQRASLQKR